LGLRLPIYPWKGYSATLPLRDPATAPVASITDEAYKVVISRLGSRCALPARQSWPVIPAA
jgi:D-amino-acid dehydrogenase